jgi:hypothetical protein
VHWSFAHHFGYGALRQPYGTQTLEKSIISELKEATASALGAAKEVMQVKLGTVICLYRRMFNAMSERASSLSGSRRGPGLRTMCTTSSTTMCSLAASAAAD